MKKIIYSLLPVCIVLLLVTGCSSEPLLGTWILQDSPYMKWGSGVVEQEGVREVYEAYSRNKLRITPEKVTVSHTLLEGALNREAAPLTQADVKAWQDVPLRIPAFDHSSLLAALIPGPDDYKITFTNSDTRQARTFFLVGSQLWLERDNGVIWLERAEETAVTPDSLEGEWLFGGMAAVAGASSFSQEHIEQGMAGSFWLTVSADSITEHTTLIQNGYTVERTLLTEKERQDWYGYWGMEDTSRPVEEICLNGKSESGYSRPERLTLYQTGDDLWYIAGRYFPFQLERE